MVAAIDRCDPVARAAAEDPMRRLCPIARSTQRWGTLALWLAISLQAWPASAAGDESQLRVVGSSTVATLAARWAEQLAQHRPGVKVAIEGTGSSTGPPALLSGRADIAGLSRAMNAAELELFRRRLGHEPVAVPVALDALAVFVNDANPLERITLVQLDAIFSRERRCGGGRALVHWGQLGLEGEWTRRSITPYGYPPTSGAHSLFRDLAMCDGGFADTLRRQPGGESCARAVAETRYGIGYGSRSLRVPGVKFLAVGRSEGAAFATVEARDLRSGAYPLTRQLYLYLREAPDSGRDPRVAEFVAQALSSEGQAAVVEAGFLPVENDDQPVEKKDERAENAVDGPG